MQIEDHPLVKFLALDLTNPDSIETVLSNIDFVMQYGEDEEPKEVRRARLVRSFRRIALTRCLLTHPRFRAHLRNSARASMCGWPPPNHLRVLNDAFSRRLRAGAQPADLDEGDFAEME